MSSCIKNLKHSFKNYQACASGYKSHQNVSSGPVLMETVANSIADTFACGGFALANIICNEKKYFQSYFCSKKISSFDAYCVDKDYMENGNDDSDDDNEYYLVDKYGLENDEYSLDDDMSDADLLSAYLDEYGDEDEEYDLVVLSEDEDETEYPPAKSLDNSWGFVDSGDLSVKFKNTTPAPMGPRKVIDFPRLILDQAKKDFFKKLASKPKQNLTRQKKMIARISPKHNFSA